MNKNHNALRNFVTAMIVVLLLATAVSGVLAALVRMENTMNTGYTAFSLERKSREIFSLTALDHTYNIDLSAVSSVRDKLSALAQACPPFMNGFITAAEQFVDWLCHLFIR